MRNQRLLHHRMAACLSETPVPASTTKFLENITRARSAAPAAGLLTPHNWVKVWGSRRPVKVALPPTTFSLPHDFHVDVTRALRNCASNRAVGPDGIPIEVYRMCPSLSVDFFVSLWSACGRVGHMPNDLTIARITPIYKQRGSPQDPDSYRPISVLNHSRKLLALAIDIGIRRHYTFQPHQWGFCEHVGADAALAFVDHALRTNARYAAFLDLKAAYPSAPRALLSFQAYYRLPSHLAPMVHMLLSPNACASSDHPNLPIYRDTVGVAQGCPASPTIFNILMDSLLEDVDLLRLPRGNAASLYADDVALISDSPQGLQDLLHTVSSWAMRSGFSWSIQKSCILSTERTNRTFLLGGLPLSPAASTSYRGHTVSSEGVLPDSNLSRIQAGSRRLQFFASSPFARSLSPRARQALVLSCIIPLVDYVLHIPSLPPAVLSASSRLDTNASKWVLSLSGRSSSTRNSSKIRALVRLPPIALRQKILALKRAVNTRQAAVKLSTSLNTNAKLVSRLHFVADLISNLPQVRSALWKTTLNTSDALASSKVSRTSRFWCRQEIERCSFPSRPIPTYGWLPPALLHPLPEGAHRVAIFYYLTSFPLPMDTISDGDFSALSKLLRKNIWTPSDISTAKNLLPRLRRDMLTARRLAPG